MWRYIRIVENELFAGANEWSPSLTTTSDCGKIFQEKKTLFGRKYGVSENAKAAYMADKLKYISLKKGTKDGQDVHFIGISSSGLKFTSISALVDAWAAEIANTGTTLAVVIAAAALIVSIVALHHK